MKFNLVNNSIVVVAASHNPSVVSQAFLNKAGIISDFSQMDENSLIITPAISQIIFKNGTSLQLDPERLMLTSLGASTQAAELADKYCKTLPFIKGTAIGINFVYTATEFDFSAWFASLRRLEYEGAESFSIDIKFPTDSLICNVKVLMNTASQATLTFNFHRDLLGIGLGDISFKILDKQKSYLETTKDFLAKLFNNGK